MAEHGHEQVVFCFDRQTGMRAIIAVHDTALGPARGGTRYKAYASEEDALEDALRLSKGMTYKFAFTDMPRGGVGGHLAGLLVANGALVTGADLDPGRAKELADRLDITVEDPEALYDLDCDVFSPNAIGGVLNEHTIARLRCRIVAGGANNQLATEADGRRLLERGILYAPDYVINSAAPYAVIGAGELRYSPERLEVSVQGVAEALRLIFRRARAEGAPTAEVADRIAEERIASAAHLRAMTPGTGAVPRA
jgi:leucine dehydrogenase